MSTEGLAGIYVPTSSYGATAAFWRSLGYVASFETGHGSGQWEHPAGGPYIFIDENGDEGGGFGLMLAVADSTAFAPDRPLDVAREWEPQHWGVVELVVTDPDGRAVSMHAPLPPGVEAPGMDEHHEEKYGSA